MQRTQLILIFGRSLKFWLSVDLVTTNQDAASMECRQIIDNSLPAEFYYFQFSSRFQLQIAFTALINKTKMSETSWDLQPVAKRRSPFAAISIKIIEGVGFNQCK